MIKKYQMMETTGIQVIPVLPASEIRKGECRIRKWKGWILAGLVTAFAVVTILSAGSVNRVINGLYEKLDSEMVISESTGSASADRASLIITSFLSVGALSNAVVSVFFFIYGSIKHDRVKEVVYRLRTSEMEEEDPDMKYRPGMTVMMEHMDDPDPIEYGTKGVIENVDDIGTIHVRWENGRRLGIIPGVDSFRLVDEKVKFRETEAR